MNRGVSGLGGGEALPGRHGITQKKGTGRSKGLGGVSVINKTTETSDSPINEAGKNISGISEGSKKHIEERSVGLAEGFSSMHEGSEQHSIAGLSAREAGEVPEDLSTTMDLSDDMAYLIQQRKKSDEELKSGVRRRVRGSEGEGEEEAKRDKEKIGGGQATGEQEEGSGEEKRRERVIRIINGVAQTLNLNEKDTKSFVEEYQTHVLGFERVSETFGAIMEEAKGNPRFFAQITDRLIKGIKIELTAQESTLDPTHLRQIMQELYRVQMCTQVKAECDMLLRDMQDLYGISKEEESEGVNSIEFSKDVLSITEASWVDADSFEPFVRMVKVEAGGQKVDFCQRFIALIKRLPDKLVDVERRQKIVEAGQEYLEQAIQEEDELGEN